MGCVFRVNANLGAGSADTREVLGILSTICDIRSVSINPQTRLVQIAEPVDINLVLHTFAKSGYRANAVHVITDKPLGLSQPPTYGHQRIHERPNRRHVDFANPFLLSVMKSDAPTIIIAVVEMDVVPAMNTV
ncbi:hypothetical protein OROMI_028098 [Orobanche minor]